MKLTWWTESTEEVEKFQFLEKNAEKEFATKKKYPPHVQL